MPLRKNFYGFSMWSFGVQDLLRKADFDLSDLPRCNPYEDSYLSVIYCHFCFLSFTVVIVSVYAILRRPVSFRVSFVIALIRFRSAHRSYLLLISQENLHYFVTFLFANSRLMFHVL